MKFHILGDFKLSLGRSKEYLICSHSKGQAKLMKYAFFVFLSYIALQTLNSQLAYIKLVSNPKLVPTLNLEM